MINPMLLHLQKLALELKCPLCLSLLRSPSLVPCDHIFCKLCFPEASQFGNECPVCKDHYNNKDIRHLHFIDNIITIYRGIDAAFAANLSPSAPGNASEEKSSLSVNYNDKSNKKLGTCSLKENLTRGVSAQFSNEFDHLSPFNRVGMTDKCNPIEIGDSQNAAVGKTDDGCNGQHNDACSLGGTKSIQQCQSLVKMINPMLLHLQKLALELKCPLCLSLLRSPSLLPCDHILCNLCLPQAQFRHECPVCNDHYNDTDIRHLHFIENIVTIYRGLDAAFAANFSLSVPGNASKGQSSISVDYSKKSDKKLGTCPPKESVICGLSAQVRNEYGHLVPFNRVGMTDKCNPIETGDNQNAAVGNTDDGHNGQHNDAYSLSSTSVDYSEKSNKKLGTRPPKENVICGLSAQVRNEYGHLSPFNRVGMTKKCNPVETGDNQNVDVGKTDDGHNAQHNDACSLGGAKSIQKCQSLQKDVNRVDLFSPGSPLSFGNIKGSQNDSNDHGGNESAQNYQVETLGKRTFDDMTTTGERLASSASETEENHVQGSKRHKMPNCAPLDKHGSDGHARPIVRQKTESVMTHAGQPSAMLDGSSTAQNVCAFCQSSKVSEDTGPMLHFVNGKQVERDEEVTLPNVIHVHNICFEWTPQVYYEGEIAKNLKEEVARGAKLKCSRCGLKGAALGCYHNSCRRSYHVTCAMEIKKCRWDDDEFLLLCPSHSSMKFPSEKSKSSKKDSKRRLIPSQIVPENPKFWSRSSNGVKEWVLCPSALSAEEKGLLVEFGTMIGMPVSKFWKSTVTHVIAATDTNGACTRTLKILMAILNGKWVLSIDWIKACMESMQPVDEGHYEISLDNHGSCGGPKTGRLGALNNAPKLFNGLKFYFCSDFQPGYKEDLQNLVINAGGTVLHGEEEAMAGVNSDLSATPSVLIVYNLDPPQGCKLGEEFTIICQRLNEAQDLAAKTGSQVIGHTWLLESIAVYKSQPVVN